MTVQLFFAYRFGARTGQLVLCVLIVVVSTHPTPRMMVTLTHHQLALAQFVAGLVLVVNLQSTGGVQLQSYPYAPGSVRPHRLTGYFNSSHVQVWLGTSAACDLLISLSVFAFFLKHWYQSQFSSRLSDDQSTIVRTGTFLLPSTVVRLVVGITESALLCSVFASIQMVLFFQYPEKLSYGGAFAMIMTKIYSNSMMVVSP